MKIISLMIMILCMNLFAQNPLDFYPHSEGDMWEYVVVDWMTHAPIDTYQVKVVKDSVDSQGNIHIYTAGRPVYPPGPWSAQPYWMATIDTLKQVWGRYSGGVNLDSTVVYKLDAQQGDKWILWTYIYHNQYEMARIPYLHDEFIFGSVRKFMYTDYYLALDSTDTLGLARYTDVLVEDLGLVERGGGLDLGELTVLRGAVIDGILYGDTTHITAIETNIHNVPAATLLFQNYPNPFNSTTHIKFDLKKSRNVSLGIYDILGKEVIRLVDNEFLYPGVHSVRWNGRNQNGIPVSTGIYIYELISDEMRVTRKMLLSK